MRLPFPLTPQTRFNAYRTSLTILKWAKSLGMPNELIIKFTNNQPCQVMMLATTYSNGKTKLVEYNDRKT